MLLLLLFVGLASASSYTSIKDYPFYASIQLFWSPICGGAILTKNHVITAAACLERAEAFYTVHAGSNYASRGGVTRYVKELKKHPKFNAQTGENDVAIVVLKNELKLSDYVQPIRIPNLDLSMAEVAMVVDVVGYRLFKESIQDRLQVIRPYTYFQRACNSIYNNTLTSDKICATVLDRNLVAFCEINRGDPMVKWDLLIGVASWGRECQNNRKPAVFTNVISAKIHNFILASVV